MASQTAGDTIAKTEAMARWLERYSLARPLEMWKQAPAGRTADMAFRAIGSDPRLLLNVDDKTAHALAREGKVVATYLEGLGGKVGDHLAVAAAAVLQRIEAFDKFQRDKEAIRAAALVSAGTPGPPPPFVIPEAFRPTWGSAFEEFPYVAPTTGATVAAMVMAIGPERLSRLDRTMREVFSVTAARYAARCARGIYKSSPLTPPQWGVIIQTVGATAALTGSKVLAVGYDGRHGTHAERAHSLAYDAMSCVDLSALGTEAGADPNLEAWEMAAEIHCYVTLALNPGVCADMDYDRVQLLAGSAARFALGAIKEPKLFPVPKLHASLRALPPPAVYAAGLRMLPDGLPRRRTDKEPGMLTRERVAGAAVQNHDGKYWQPIVKQS